MRGKKGTLTDRLKHEVRMVLFRRKCITIIPNKEWLSTILVLRIFFKILSKILSKYSNYQLRAAGAYKKEQPVYDTIKNPLLGIIANIKRRSEWDFVKGHVTVNQYRIMGLIIELRYQ